MAAPSKLEFSFTGVSYYQGAPQSMWEGSWHFCRFDLRNPPYAISAPLDLELSITQEQILSFDFNEFNYFEKKLVDRIRLTPELAKTMTLSARMFQQHEKENCVVATRCNDPIPITFPLLEVGRCYRLRVVSNGQAITATVAEVDEATSDQVIQSQRRGCRP